MNYYRIKARLKSPLSISQNRHPDASQCVSYMPGSTLRGAVAAKYLNEIGTSEDPDFCTLFLNNPVSFPNLFPGYQHGAAKAKILPLTCISCKRHSGFKKMDSDEFHGVTDLLAAKILERFFPENYEQESCPVCNNEMKPFTGFWNASIQSPRSFTPTMMIQRHTGIDRTTGTIAPQIFYTSQSIADYYKADDNNYYPQFLTGSIFLSDEQYKILSSILEVSSEFFAGSDRTSGKGEFVLSLENTEPPTLDVLQWNNSFKNKLKHLFSSIPKTQKMDDFFNGYYFTINLDSEAILTDKFLRPTYKINPKLKNIDADKIEFILKVARSQTVHGWNSAWRLPKPDETAVAMGSVYLFKYTGEDIEILNKDLLDFMSQGTGLRKQEGFGRISICNDIHTVKEVI